MTQETGPGVKAGSRGRIVVTGMAFYIPLSGVVWQVLHYLIGLRQLGYDVYYIEDSPRWVYDYDAQATVPDATGNVELVSAPLEAHGFSGRWAFRNDHPVGKCHGLQQRQILDLYATCDALLNITGQELNADQLQCRRRLLVESDPFASQVKYLTGDPWEETRVRAHDAWFTFGENIGQHGCGIPHTGVDWMPTRQPIVIDLWRERVPASAEARYTTITTWSNSVPALAFEGETYHWQKGVEFEKILDLPSRTPADLEIAVNTQPEVVQRLVGHGWHHTSSERLSLDPESYREYIVGSRGEVTVARDQYVRPRTGWFSDRSACYLAAGKPVVTQDTGFGDQLPTGCGLFAFDSVEDIASAIESIESDYNRHSRTAGEIAAEYFDAPVVLRSLLERAGL